MQNTREKLYAEIMAGLRSIGYQGALLQEDYGFADWFTPQTEERRVAAAAFGQTPISYDSACIGVARANGECGPALINKYRALGAPILLEISDEEIREWAVSRRENGHGLVERYPTNGIAEMLANRAPDWRPQSLLRAKNIGSFHWSPQLGLFAGLVPELEAHIHDKLDPLLRETLSTTRSVYRESTGHDADTTQLFKLVFGILTAKVFYDRRIPRFSSATGDPDELLSLVARHYKTASPTLLNKATRQAAADRIWTTLDFRNLSVEVLAQIWSTSLVDREIRRQLSIHRTSRTIVRYMIERIPFGSAIGDDKRIILEPCAGSAVFLVGAMNLLREHLFGASPAERHSYFVQHLAAIEKDPFAVEISRLALTLADFPNPDGWDIANKDVFIRGALADYLQRAGVVLCNPPFGDFDENERVRYQPVSVSKPAELLYRVLEDLRPDGVVGFVMPRTFVDGRRYAGVREQVAKRFGSIELTILPDRAFEADSEIALLVATDPIPHNACRVTSRKVNDDPEAWAQFQLSHKVSTDYVADFPVKEAEQNFIVPDLPELWAALINHPTLGEFSELHRGIEWNRPLTKAGIETGHRPNLVRDEPAEGFRRGIAPKTKIDVFEQPPVKYLSMRPEDQRTNAWQFAWHKPKAILGKAARSRGAWRMAAFPDSDGVICYQTFIGVWPTVSVFDEWLLSAVLNSPVANAFVATREGKTDITVETLRLIPVPHFTDVQRTRIRSLIIRYRSVIARPPLEVRFADDPERLLKEIDATVLDGYGIPPRRERQLLDFFRGQARPTPTLFSDYVPADCTNYFSLSDYLSPDFAAATSGELLKRMAGR